MFSSVTTKFKSIVLNNQAYWMNDITFINYVILLSLFRLKNFSVSNSKYYPHFKLCKIFYKKQSILFQSPKRISRFIYGFNYAGKRVWKRYNIDELLEGEVPKTILDVGANIGEFSNYAYEKYRGGTKIIAFEPDPIAIECFENNVNNNDIILYKLALSNKNGFENFFLKTESADSSIHKPIGYSITCEVKTIMLDSILECNDFEKPILLKMDAEGHEPEVLIGALKSLSQISYICIDAGFERSGSSTSSEVAQILIDHGFKYVNIQENHVVTARLK
jgi:FkbM family methyltransferase